MFLIAKQEFGQKFLYQHLKEILGDMNYTYGDLCPFSELRELRLLVEFGEDRLDQMINCTYLTKGKLIV